MLDIDVQDISQRVKEAMVVNQEFKHKLKLVLINFQNHVFELNNVLKHMEGWINVRGSAIGKESR